MSSENTTTKPETKAAIIPQIAVSRVRGEELLTGFKSLSTRVLTAGYKLGTNVIYMVNATTAGSLNKLAGMIKVKAY